MKLRKKKKKNVGTKLIRSKNGAGWGTNFNRLHILKNSNGINININIYITFLTLGKSGRLSSCSLSGSFAFWSSGVGCFRVKSQAATRFRRFAITIASSLRMTRNSLISNKIRGNEIRKLVVKLHINYSCQ